MKICVMSRGGRGGKDDPYVFHLGQRRLPVVAIVSEWLEPPCRCFLVRVDDGRIWRRAAAAHRHRASLAGRRRPGRRRPRRGP